MKPPFDISGDLDTPVSAFMKLAAFEPRFLLESVEGGERLARYSFIGFGDGLEVKLDRDGLRVGRERRPIPANSFELLQALRDALKLAPQPQPDIAGVPLAGGLVGYSSYDVVRFFERLPARIESGTPALHYIAQLPPIPNMESLGLVFQPKIAKDDPDLIVRFVRATLRGVEFIKTSPKEKTAELVAKKMNDPRAVPVIMNALGSVKLTDPRLDMPSTRILLKVIAKQGKIPAELVGDVDGWIGKYLDYTFLDRAEASLKKS